MVIENMKIGIKFFLFVSVIVVLSGCGTPVQSIGTPTFMPVVTQPTPVDLTPTPVITETSVTTGSFTWETGISDIFQEQCSLCHGTTPSGGFSINSYTRVIQGSNIGPIIIPGNPEESHIFIKLKYAGNHPGYLSKEQTEIVWNWIENGALE